MTEMRELIEQIGIKYKKLKAGERDWTNEQARVKDLIEAIGQQIRDRYTLGDAIGVGGAGIVLKVNDMNLGAVYALKMPRPVEGREQLMGIIMEREISRLLAARHDNIVSVFYRDEIELSGQKWPFYIMEYIDGATDAAAYLGKEDYDYRSLIHILDQAVRGLAFLHSQRIVHCDVKFENILVSPDGKAKISDLGSARALDQEMGGHTTLVVTKDWAHPELLRRADVTHASESNRMRAEIDRSNLRPAFDLYPLGKNLLHMLAKQHSSDRIPAYYGNYLGLMGCRLLDGQNQDSERSFLNLTTRTLSQIKYNSLEEVSADLAKITGQYTLHDAVPELNHHYPQTVQISSSGATSFTERVSRLLSLPYFRRLAAVSQLGLIVQIYPSASHSRLEHMLGTYANAAKYCDALWNDPLNPLFKQIMTEHDIKLVLVTALCHDIGQYPLAHDFEGADRSVFDHGKLNERFLTDASSPHGQDLRDQLARDWQIKAQEVVQLLKVKQSDYDAPLKLRLLHSIIDGPIDADKLDYLVRDSNHLNVPYGRAIDLDRLLRCLTVVLTPKHAGHMFVSVGIHEKGKIPAETIAFVRYAMFGSVYWHHTSRSAKSMLHRAIWEALERQEKRGNMHEELFRELLRHCGAAQSDGIQTTLFQCDAELSEAPQLSQTDYQMLKWLADRTSDQGKAILKMICSRSLFKRLAVLSHRGNTKLWEDLKSFASDAGWKQNLAFQRLLQTNLVASACERAKDEGTKIEQSFNERDVLFILDIARGGAGSSTDLFFLPEARLHGPILSSEDDEMTEDSLLWTSLAKNFVESVGKTRLFCHPRIVGLCCTYLDRREIESAIEVALQSVK